MPRRFRFKKDRFGSIPELSMTPMIDVALTLLVIFIVASPMIHHSIKVNLPQGQIHEVKGNTKNTVVYLDKGSKIYINGDAVSKTFLLSHLKKRENKDETIFIQADRAVDYGTVIELVDDIKLSGVKHVALATKKCSSQTARA